METDLDFVLSEKKSTALITTPRFFQCCDITWKSVPSGPTAGLGQQSYALASALVQAELHSGRDPGHALVFCHRTDRSGVIYLFDIQKSIHQK